MKRWLWWTIIGIILLVIFGGYAYTSKIQTRQYYENSIAEGKQHIKDGDYKAAKLSYRNALKKKPNDQLATVVLGQLNNYQRGLNEVNKRQYSKAKAHFQKASNVDAGSSMLVRRSAGMATELTEVLKERKIFTKAYRRAEILADNYEYTASNTKLAVILGYGSITEDYYQDLYQKAKKLKNKNDQILSSLGYTVDSDTDTSSDSSKNTKQNVIVSNHFSSDEVYQNITKKEIKQARKILKQRGLDEKAFTDEQVKQVIWRSKNEGKNIQDIADEFK